MMKKNSSRLLIIKFFLCFLRLNSNQIDLPFKRIFEENFLDDQRYSIDDCVPLAFGDFNADKIIDIFCRTSSAQTIRVMINDDRSTRVVEQCRAEIPHGQIFDVIAADFDADSRLDLFVLYKRSSNEKYFSGGFFWGNRKSLSDFQPLNISFASNPTALDANGDSNVDLLGMMFFQGEISQPTCLTFFNRNIHNVILLTDITSLLINASQATVDLNNDLVADLFVTTNNRDRPKFGIRHLPLIGSTWIERYDPPDDATIFHLSRFADIDADGKVEHLLPVCMDVTCHDSRIYVRQYHRWFQIPIDFDDDFRFPLSNELPSPFDQYPLSIKLVDYDLDGFPDMTLLMKQISTDEMIPIVLLNQKCQSTDDLICSYNRTFVIQTGETSLFRNIKSTSVMFFDLFENGYPDLLVVQGDPLTNYSLIGFQNSLVQDVNFFKVMVLSTFSCKQCSRQRRLPYGNNQPGQSVKMETISTSYGFSDDWIQLAAIQMPQAGQMTFELPYVIFGLGSTPNFVEKLSVGLPPNAQSNKLVRTYTQMIPNSQVVVIPSPLNDPNEWQTKLFITPSRLILHTGIALAATLVVLLVVLAALQYREKREDNLQRREQSQSFHYDAL